MLKHLLKIIKRKKSPAPPQQSSSPARPASITAAQPPTPQADPDVIPDGVQRSHSYQDLGLDRPDLAVPLDEIGGDGAKEYEEMSETRTSGVAFDQTGPIYEPTIEGPSDTVGEENEPVVAPSVTKGEHTSLGGSGGATEKFGLLKATLRAILTVHPNRGGTIAVGNRIKVLLSRVDAVEEHFNSCPDDVADQRRRTELIRDLKGIDGQLRLLADGSGSHRLTDQVQDDEVFTLLEDLQEAIFQYQRVQRTTIEDQGIRLIDSAEATVINNFRCAKQAEYRHGNRNGCLKGTRRTVLDEIELWTRNFEEPPVYWLNGLAGTGKSTIAQTVAERMFADGRLGASFFCSRDFEDRSNLHFIFPTLAVQLARRYPKFRSIFVPLVQSDPEVASESLYGQMNRLIVQPLVKSSVSTVIVIDALDECKDEEPSSAILSVLGRLVGEVPLVKFFVTGRPEPRIEEGFRLPLLAKATDVFVLHDVEPSLVNNDIRLFFRQSFEELKGRLPDLDGWPTEEQQDVLCERAAGLFVHAVATVRFIYQRNTNPKRQLDRLLQSPESSAFEGKTKFKGDATLDSLYASILQEAFGDNDSENDPRVRSVLGAVILAANPLSPSTIAALLDLDAGDVFPFLSSVQSLLIFQGDDLDHPVRPFHKSFPDFIIDPVRCANPRFRVSPLHQHAELLVGCLELMNRRLERNMCKLPDGVINSEIDDLGERIERHIDQTLQYACRSWHKHLVDTISAQALEIRPILHHFLEKKFIFWLEVLSVLGAAREAVDALDAARKWLDVSPTLDLVRDYFRFVTAFFGVITTSAPHIFHSALPLSPRTSMVLASYKQYAHPFARVARGLPTSWEASGVITKYDFNFFGNVAWSPGGGFVVVAKFESIDVLDAATLHRLDTIASPSMHSEWLSLSPDSRLLMSFHRRDGIAFWDLQTGGPVATTLAGPDPWLTSRHFSSTYSIDGKVVAVSYGEGLQDSDTFIITYELHSKTRTQYHIPGGRVIILIWTHGEYLRFATVARGSITIWEAAFTLTPAPTEVESLPAPDEIADGHNLLFLPALSRLAFTLRNEILVWDAKASRLLLKSTLAPTPRNIANRFWKSSFSSDGHFFASITNTGEVYVWKESPAGYALHQKLAFAGVDAACTLHFSPNGESIILHTDHTLRLWSTKDQILSNSVANTPTWESHDYSFLLETSPSKTLAAFARQQGNTVTVLDLHSGGSRLVIDTDMRIECLGVTESTVVVAGKKTIVTWNIPADSALDARANVTDSIRTATFDPLPLDGDFDTHTRASMSPDFSRIAFADDTRGIGETSLGIYNVSDGRFLGGVTTYHLWSRPRFAPDGREVWIMTEPHREGWEITEDNESAAIELAPLRASNPPLGTLPWQSSYGYEVTDDGWVLGSARKRLLWLPHHWRSEEGYREWSGRFLGLVHGELPEPVILEFFE